MFDEKEKITVEFKKPKVVDFDFGNNTIKVVPFIPIGDRSAFIEQYVEKLLEDSEEDIATRYVASELVLILGIVENFTNVSIKDIDVNLLTYSGLWEEIKNRISNYQDLRNELSEVISLATEKRRIEKSVGYVIDAVAEKVFEWIEKLPELDAENFKDTSNQLISKLNELNEKVPGIISDKKKPSKKSKNEKSSQ